MKSEEKKKRDQRLALFLGGGTLLVLLYFFIVVTPQGEIYKYKLRTLRSEQVQMVRLHMIIWVDGKSVGKERILKQNEVAEFLGLISDARSYSPNHPRGGWTCSVDITTTTDIPRFSFLVHSTNNNGVHFNLDSNPNGGSGWSYGTLRNDALGPFIEALFRNGS
jgi:hypothetical protein